MKETLFIQKENFFAVPKPDSANFGRARYEWLKKRLGIESHIASPESWNDMKKISRVMKVIEFDDGEVAIFETED